MAFQNDLADLLEAESPIKEEICYRTLLRSSVNEELTEGDIIKCLSHIDDEVNNLFVALRVVDSLSGLHHYQLQRQTGDQAFTPRNAANSVPSAAQRLRLLDETIQLAEGVVDALRRQGTNSKGVGGGLLAEKFETQTRQLERWRKTRNGEVTAEMASLLEGLGRSLRSKSRILPLNEQLTNYCRCNVP